MIHPTELESIMSADENGLMDMRDDEPEETDA